MGYVGAEKRWRTVAIVLALVFLTVTAVPAAASSHTNTALGSIHTNDTDFNNADKLDNVAVNGSGDDAFVELINQTVYDDFEDGDISEYSGDTASATVQSSTVFEGTEALQIDASGGSSNGISSTSGLDDYPEAGDNFSVYFQYGNDDPEPSFGWAAQQETSEPDDMYRWRLEGSTDDLQLQVLSGGSATTEATANFDVAGNQDSWLRAEIDWQSDGTQTVTIYNGSTNLASAEMSDATLSSGGVHFGVNDQGTGGTSIAYFDFVSDTDVGTPGTYIGANHSVDNVQSGFTNLTLDNASAEVTWQEHDGSAWTDVNSSTFTTTGNHTLDISAATNTDTRVNVTFTKTGDDPTARLHDEGVLFENRAPELSDPEPTGGEFVNEQPIEVSVNVSDEDLPTTQGDEVTVTFYDGDDNEMGSDTLTANGTASTEYNNPIGGGNEWYAIAEDSYGGTDRSPGSGTHTFDTVGAIDIRDENEPHELINESTVEVLASGSGETVDRQTVTNGRVNLTGLPTDEEYVIVVDAPGYHVRQIIVEDLFEQSTVFVLNESQSSVENAFFVQDNTGRYDDPKLVIDKVINRSIYDNDALEEYQWTTIGGDRLGADSRLIIDLQESDRYRITIENEEGDRRILGEYTAAAEGTVTLTVGTITWTNPDGGGYQIEAYQENVSASQDNVVIQYADENNLTSEFCVEVHEDGNQSNVLYAEDCVSDIGEYKATIQVTGDDLNTSWVANWSATVAGEEYGATTALTGIRELSIPISQPWLGAGVYILLIGGLAATPKASARTGALLIAVFAFGLAWWGWVAIPGPALALAGAIALLGKGADFNNRY